MGKFLIGCLGVVLLVVVAGGGVAWFKFIKPGMDFAGEVVRMGEEYQELDRAIENRSDYRPPSGGAVSEDQFRRFLAAQSGIRVQMAGRLEELKDKYESLQADLDDRDAEPGLREIAGAYRDLGDLLLEAKRAQVDAINSQDFSLQEYQWVRNQVYQAIGESVAVAAVGPQAEGPRSGRVPAETVEMIRPHREELMELYALAWWGL